jgi:hypothetical protein
MSQVINLKPVAKSNPNRSNRKQAKKLHRQGMAAVGIGMVASTLTVLSLNHLAHGITIVTQAPNWEAWSMAAGIDLGFISLELAQLAAASEKVLKQITKFTRPAIVGTLIGSAVMNAFAFATQAVGWMIAPAVAMGVAIPALIYLLTRAGAHLYMDCHNKG